MALSHNFSTQISDLEKLKEIAANAGFTQTRGTQKGEGSIRQLLEALISGMAMILPKPNACELNVEERRSLEIQQKLFEKGLISEIKLRRNHILSPFNPLTVEGEPLSQTVIRERR